jgi:hypothetical protein
MRLCASVALDLRASGLSQHGTVDNRWLPYEIQYVTGSYVKRAAPPC